MGKVIRKKAKGPSKEEQIKTLIREAAYNLFDRIPRGSLSDSEVDKLVEKITKI